MVAPLISAFTHWFEVCPTGSPSTAVCPKSETLKTLNRWDYPLPPSLVLSPHYFQMLLQNCGDDRYSSTLAPQSPQQWQRLATDLQQAIQGMKLPQDWRSSLRQGLEAIQEAWQGSQGQDGFVVLLRPDLGQPPHGQQPLMSTGLLEAEVVYLPQPLDEQVEVFWLGLLSLYGQMVQVRSLIHWQTQGYQLREVPLGVLVQPLIPAKVSGTLTVQGDRYWIEVAPGLGFSVLRGEVQPDRYHIQRNDRRILQHAYGCKPLRYDLVKNPSHPNPLRLTWTDASYQYSPCLSPDQLNTLLQCLDTLLQTQPQICYLEWLLTDGAPYGLRQDRLFWLQARDWSDLTQPITPISQPSNQPQTLIGRGVSSGAAVGQLYWLDEERNPDLAAPLPPAAILVGESLTLKTFPLLEKAVGLVLAQGGVASHGAILARELRLPAVVAVGDRLHSWYTLPPQTWVGVDGDQGCALVLDMTQPPPLEVPTLDLQNQMQSGGTTNHEPDRPTTSITALQIFATVNHPQSLDSLASLESGIGLLRSEWFFLDILEQTHPALWIERGHRELLLSHLQTRLEDCLNRIYPHPLFYRSFDFRATELQSLQGLTGTWNQGGTLSHCLNPIVFDLELELLERVNRPGAQLRFILPLVRTVQEFQWCHDRLRQYWHPQATPLALWIMAEVPSVLFCLPDLVAAGVQGIAIGPRDLTQHLLALPSLTQKQEEVMYGMDHPLVHGVILQLIHQAQSLQIPSILCNHLSTFPDRYLDDYLGAGLWGITSEVPYINPLSWAIAAAETRLPKP